MCILPPSPHPLHRIGNKTGFARSTESVSSITTAELPELPNFEAVAGNVSQRTAVGVWAAAVETMTKYQNEECKVKECFIVSR